MKQTLILLAGYPGTGKSYLAKKIIDKISSFTVFSPDDIKEKFWDQYGFDSLTEKEQLIELSWKAYFEGLDNLFQIKKNVISDYPFSEKQKEKLVEITNIHKVQVITIRLVGDLNILFERQKIRDLNNTRHLGHIVSRYHKNQLINHKEADNLLNYDEFINRCTTRGYEIFSLGYTLEIDVSDFSKINYDAILKNIITYVE